MAKTRLELINELAKLEHKLETFKSLKKDVDNSYAKHTTGTFEINGTIHYRQYHGDSIQLNSTLFSDYLSEEISLVSGQIVKLINEISEYK